MSELLNSWKEITRYLDRGVRTVQRRSIDGNLPIRRVGAGNRAPVIAFAHELDNWLRKHRALKAIGRTPVLQSESQELLKESERLISSLKRSGVDFLFIDLEVAMTMARSALNAGRDTERRARSQKIARRAYDTILHLSGRLKMTQEERSSIRKKLSTLKRALEELEEQF